MQVIVKKFVNLTGKQLINVKFAFACWLVFFLLRSGKNND